MRSSIKLVSPLLLALSLGLTAACGASQGGRDRLAVVATVYPLGYFSERVGGDLVDVQVLIGSGVEAHGFDPTASDLLAINAADVIVMNGLGLEPWLERAIDALGEGAQGILVEAADAALAREGIVHGHGDEDDDGEEGDHGDEDAEEGDHGDEEGHEDVDPHMWLDPTLAVRQVERIRDAFAAADAANADAYKQNADALIAELDALDEEFAEGLGDCRHEHFVASHAAYGYLAGRYGAKQVPVAGLSAEAEPSPRRLAEISDQVTEMGLGYVLVEPVLSGGPAQTLARETGIELVPIHAIGSVTEDELDAHGDYFGLMRDNLASLRLALECS